MHGVDGTDFIEFAFESVATAGVPPSVFIRMARQASDFNRRMGLTGFLEFRGGRFRCAIEGRSEVLLPLAGRILADSRHREIRTLAFHAVGSRSHDGWRVEGDYIASAELASNLRFLPERRVPGRVVASAARASIHQLGAGSL